MSNNVNIVKQKAKHGIFSYYKNDKFLAKSFKEYGEYSEYEVNLFKYLTNPGDNIIEVGSNIGAHTVPIAKHISNKGIVYALEPQTQNYKILVKNINENKLTNTKIYKLAATNSIGEAYINTFAEDKLNNFGSARISNKKNINSETIKTTTLDDLLFDKFDEKKILKLIKCDAQGQEENIINGSTKLIEKFNPFLYVENDIVEKSKSLIETISKLNYLLFWHIVPLFNPKNFFKNFNNVFSNIHSINMLCVHRKTKFTLPENWKKLHIDNPNFHPLKKTGSSS